MALKSTLYQCQVFHERKKPKRNRFSYPVFLWQLDLDEIGYLASNKRIIGHNRFNLFSFYDNDHFKQRGANGARIPVRQKLETYLAEHGVQEMPARVKLLTSLRIFGYVFNLVSFYYCYNNRNEVYCTIAEVTNTYGEMKMYLLLNSDGKYFTEVKQKHFYISPFTKLDDHLELKVGLPADKIRIFINDFDREEIKVRTVLSGQQKALTTKKLIFYLVRFPFLTLQVISLIHWQALKLWIKGVEYIPKAENPGLQKDIYYTNKVHQDGSITLQEGRRDPA